MSTTYVECIKTINTIEKNNIMIFDLDVANSVTEIMKNKMMLNKNPELLERVFKFIRYLGLKLDGWDNDEICNSFLSEVVYCFVDFLIEKFESDVDYKFTDYELFLLSEKAFNLVLDMEKWQFRNDINYSHCEIETNDEKVAVKVIEILNNKMNLNYK